MRRAKIMREPPALLIARTNERHRRLAERAGELRDVVEMRFETLEIFIRAFQWTAKRELEIQGLFGSWRWLAGASHGTVTLFNTPGMASKRHRGDSLDYSFEPADRPCVVSFLGMRMP